MKGGRGHFTRMRSDCGPALAGCARRGPCRSALQCWHDCTQALSSSYDLPGAILGIRQLLSATWPNQCESEGLQQMADAALF